MKSRENVNTACQIRVGNTEAYRKYAMNKKDMEYNDDRPPIYHPGDGGGGGGGGAVEGNSNDDSEEKNDEPEGGSRWIGSDKAKMCPHYRQLTSESLAKSAFQSLVPDRQRVNCCSRGGDKTRFGAHDIEDLVNFGVLPNVKRGIALYRETSTGASFGLKLKQVKGKRGPISVKSVSKIGAAASEGTIKEGDNIISINNLDISSGSDVNDISNRIRDASDPLLLDVYQGDGNKIDQNEYSEESACPYYLSRALAKDADIVFCPYNYVLDPNIRNAMEIDIKNSIVVLDEAHNVEDTLRQEGSGKFGEIELLEMNVLLSSYASRWIPRELLSPFGKEKESLHDKIPEITHDILVFLDKIIDIMRGSRHIFESDQGE
jgi:Fanconi anemia group J protein